MRRHLSSLILLWPLALGACGTRGSLTLPPPRTSPTVSASPVSPQAAPSAQIDLTTAKEPAR